MCSVITTTNLSNNLLNEAKMYISTVSGVQNNMEPVKFTNGNLVLDAFITNDGEYLFHGKQTCINGKLSDYSNASKYIKKSLPKKWYREVKVGIGRPGIYLLEPGLYYLLMESTNSEAFEFKNWVFEEVLPNIRKQGFHIDSEAVLADKSKLEALEKQTESLINQLEVAEQLNYQMREYIDSELGKEKEKVVAEAKIKYACFNDGDDNEPLIFKEYKNQQSSANKSPVDFDKDTSEGEPEIFVKQIKKERDDALFRLNIQLEKTISVENQFKNYKESQKIYVDELLNSRVATIVTDDSFLLQMIDIVKKSSACKLKSRLNEFLLGQDKVKRFIDI
jgi:prophage antirepressor-like protein